MIKEILKSKQNNIRICNGLILIIAFVWIWKIAPLMAVVADVWYLLSTGQYIVTHHQIPHINPFIQESGRSIVIQNWLSCVTDYSVYQKFGEYGLVVYGAICSFLIIIALYFFIRSYTKNIKIIMPVFLVSCFVLSSAMNFRAASISCTVLMIEQILIKKYRDNKASKAIWLLPIFSLFIVNFHASYWLFFFIFAAPYVISFSLKGSELIKMLQGKKKLLCVLFVSFLVGFINPYGTKSMFYLLYSYGSASQGDLISELRSPQIWTITGFFVVMAIAFIILFVIAKIKGHKRDLLLAAGCTALAAMSVKNIWMIPIGCIPIITVYLQSIDKKEISLKNIRLQNILFVVAICVLCFVKNDYSHYMSKDNLCSPIKAVEYLDQYDKNSVKVYGYQITNNYLEWNGYKVVMDSRPEVYNEVLSGGADLYAEEILIEKGEIDYQKFLEKNEFTHIITYQNIEMEGLSILDAYLTGSKDYKLVVDGNGYKMYELQNF